MKKILGAIFTFGFLGSVLFGASLTATIPNVRATQYAKIRECLEAKYGVSKTVDDKTAIEEILSANIKRTLDDDIVEYVYRRKLSAVDMQARNEANVAASENYQ